MTAIASLWCAGLSDDKWNGRLTVCQEDFELALKQLRPSIKPEELEKYSLAIDRTKFPHNRFLRIVRIYNYSANFLQACHSVKYLQQFSPEQGEAFVHVSDG